MAAKLPFHEWCIILLFCAILLLLSVFALAGRKYVPAPASRIEAPMETAKTVIRIKVEGEVANAETFEVPSKITLKELLEKAQPLSTADLSQLNWRRKLRDGQTIKVPERRWITIQIAGAVQNPGPLKILSGTRMLEIVDQIEPLPEADLKSIQKRRSFLKEGETVEIPVKKAKQPKKPPRKKPAKKQQARTDSLKAI